MEGPPPTQRGGVSTSEMSFANPTTFGQYNVGQHVTKSVLERLCQDGGKVSTSFIQSVSTTLNGEI